MNCKNCDKALSGSQRYCDNCGAQIIMNRLTPKILAKQINEQFLSIDNKFLQTFIALFVKPEHVIDGYINGLRKKYIGVITYYAISLTILGFQMFLLKNFFPEFLEAKDTLFNKGFQTGIQNSENPSKDFLDFFNNYQGVFFSILMPFLAIGTWVIYLDKGKHNYTEHLVINLYSTAQTIYIGFIFYLLLAAFKIQDYLTASLIVAPPTILYGTYVFKRIYKSSFIKSIIRYIAAYTIYTIIFSIMMAIIMVVLIAYLFATGKLKL
ncbi:DUF3667 domain-containing protein [Winogradskyella sp.]|uniref:DUF3667 domain-containing protein n=1 Tax=Winogradskyella sp. TaxID=1883156 RepID=UPI002604E3FF|nr:DUF3667 domain-containing protein [Winogradskyella sp.]